MTVNWPCTFAVYKAILRILLFVFLLFRGRNPIFSGRPCKVLKCLFACSASLFQKSWEARQQGPSNLFPSFGGPCCERRPALYVCVYVLHFTFDRAICMLRNYLKQTAERILMRNFKLITGMALGLKIWGGKQKSAEICSPGWKRFNWSSKNWRGWCKLP